MASAEILAAGLEEGRAKQVMQCIACDGPCTKYMLRRDGSVKTQITCISSNKPISGAAFQLGSREASAMGQGHEKAAQPPRDDQGRRQRQSGLLQAQEGTIIFRYLVQTACIEAC